ncbi:MAG: winged helix-turn-helix domain-containing protein [Anaerolineae bacterium]
MPPVADLLTQPSRPPISFALEPALNVFNSLSLLTRAEYMYGLDDWVTRTLAALPKDRRHRHELIFVGLYFAIEPQRSFANFPAFIADVAQQTPEVLRDRVLDTYLRLPICAPIDKKPAPVEKAALLANKRAFLKFLRERFSPDHVIEAIEIEAHALLNDPPRMQQIIVDHLQTMWHEVAEPEWTNVKPMLQACVDAYQQIDLSNLSIPDAAERVLGRPLDDDWRAKLSTVERIVFVPSAHVGPYLTKFNAPRHFTLVFGARQPQGAAAFSPDLSRSELLVRVVALADDVRLRILRLIAEQGEMCSPDIIRQLNLSQSAASRQLQQLTATGYLNERRREGAKCYTLNAERIDDTFHALARFLQSKH